MVSFIITISCYFKTKQLTNGKVYTATKIQETAITILVNMADLILFLKIIFSFK